METRNVTLGKFAARLAEQIHWHESERDREDVSRRFVERERGHVTGLWTAVTIFESLHECDLSTLVHAELACLRAPALDERDVYTCPVCGREVDAENDLRWLNDGQTAVCTTCADTHATTGLWLAEDDTVWTQDALVDNAVDHLAGDPAVYARETPENGWTAAKLRDYAASALEAVRLPLDGSPVGQAEPDPHTHPAIGACAGCGKDIPSRFEYCRTCVTGEPHVDVYAECDVCGDEFRDDFLYTSVDGQRVCTGCISGSGLHGSPVPTTA